jgi:hypothetical protein
MTGGIADRIEIDGEAPVAVAASAAELERPHPN